MDCPNHRHITDGRLLAMTETEAAVCDWLWRRWLLLKMAER